MAFRTLNILQPSDSGRYKTKQFEELLKDVSLGYHAFYFDPSPLDELATTRATELRDLLLKRINIENKSNETPIVDALSLSSDEKPKANEIYLLGTQLQSNFAEKAAGFLRKVREISALQDSPFSKSIALALHQASSYELRGERSWFLSNTLRNYEYFLWDDSGLWRQEQWDYEVSKLSAQPTEQVVEEPAKSDIPQFSPIAAEQRLCWAGSGAISLQLRHLCEADRRNPWLYPIALAQILDAAIARLERFDSALLEYYRKTPPGYLNSDYVRLLCNFLPDHRSRLNPKKFLSSNSLGDFGGPRLWQGVNDWRLEMKLMHLLLDGLLTLWPKTPEREATQGTELVLQPANLAILYWAARTADMPWTKTPEEFLNNYQWNDPTWFGGRRQHWLGMEWMESR